MYEISVSPLNFRKSRPTPRGYDLDPASRFVDDFLTLWGTLSDDDLPALEDFTACGGDMLLAGRWTFVDVSVRHGGRLSSSIIILLLVRWGVIVFWFTVSLVVVSELRVQVLARSFTRGANHVVVLQYSTLLCCTVLHISVLNSTVQYSTVF
jgi:hypothetical protein